VPGSSSSGSLGEPADMLVTATSAAILPHDRQLPRCGFGWPISGIVAIT
jgi:hypothetical protein